MVTIEDDKKKKSSPKFWHVQQEKILKTWGEQSACYRYMHYKAYEKYKRLSMGFTLPIIVISTVTGTANFAQQTFPASWQTLAPVVIGGLNLFSAILTTVLQFLKINELLESHRVSSIQYGKLSRSIRLQLTLPAYERSQGGDVMIETCGAEYDRLIEQSPPVPNEVIQLFEREFPPGSSDLTRPGAQPGCCGGGGLRRRPRPLDITRPEIINITEISPYDSKGELTVAKEVRSAFRAKAKSVSGPVRGFNYEESKKEVLAELESLKEKSLVTRETSPPTVIQNTEPEHVTLEVSKVDELKKSFEKS
jgi:hypothetical protein